MGTHPIFESDFDCLTEFRMAKKTGESAKKSKSKEIAKSSKPKKNSKNAKKGEKKVKPEDKVNATLDKMRELLQNRLSRRIGERRLATCVCPKERKREASPRFTTFTASRKNYQKTTALRVFKTAGDLLKSEFNSFNFAACYLACF